MRTRRSLLTLVLPLIANAAGNYSAEKAVDHGIDVVRLTDRATGVEVSITPSIGNRAYELKVHGQNLLYASLPNLAELKNGTPPAFNGIPFLAPWANRLAGKSFWANDKKYILNSSLGTVHVSSNGTAIHGMLTASSLWQVSALKADEKSAQVTSRLPFWRHPELMANWPFAQEYEMTYRLSNGALQVTVSVKNLSAEPMPMAIGFHPYLQIPGVKRAEEKVHMPARKHVETNSELVATGELTRNDLPEQVSLRDRTFDDGFTDLIRNSNGEAVFSVQAGTKKIEVVYGPKYRVAVVYAPPGQDYICFEPMTAITNGINLTHDGKYAELQTVAPGALWNESFWIRWSGF